MNTRRKILIGTGAAAMIGFAPLGLANNLVPDTEENCTDRNP